MKHRKEIAWASKKHSLDMVLVAAIVLAESAERSKSARYEGLGITFYEDDTFKIYRKAYKYVWKVRENAKLHRISHDTEEVFQKTSWGLMHIMGGTARWLGFQGWLPDLADPRVGLDWGCAYLARIAKKYQAQSDIIAAYNWGSAKKKPNGLYYNQEYVDRVNEFYISIIKEVRPCTVL